MTASHPLVRMIGESMKWDQIANPRSKMEVSRLIIRTFPFIMRAVKMQADFVGKPIVLPKADTGEMGKKVKMTLDEFHKTMPIQFVQNPDYKWYTGMANLTSMIVKGALMDGMNFFEEMYNGKQFDGVVVYPTERFDMYARDKRFMLRYTAPGGLSTDVEQSDHFHAFGLSFMPGSLWGLSLTDGGEFFSEMLVQMIIARKNNYTRLGNPPGLNIFTLENYENFTDPDFEEYKARVEEGEKKFMEAIYASQNGQSAEVFMKLLGSVKFDNRMYGDGAQGLTGFKDDVEWTARQLSLLTGIPPEFLAFDSGAAGIGADKFRILNGLLTSSVEGIQNMVEPIVKRIDRNYLISIKAPSEWLDAFDIGFSEPDINDRKADAETENTRAQALGQHLTNASKLWFELGLGDIDQLNAYFREVGLPWLQLTEPPQDPQPDPSGGGQ